MVSKLLLSVEYTNDKSDNCEDSKYGSGCAGKKNVARNRACADHTEYRGDDYEHGLEQKKREDRNNESDNSLDYNSDNAFNGNKGNDEELSYEIAESRAYNEDSKLVNVDDEYRADYSENYTDNRGDAYEIDFKRKHFHKKGSNNGASNVTECYRTGDGKELLEDSVTVTSEERKKDYRNKRDGEEICCVFAKKLSGGL